MNEQLPLSLAIREDKQFDNFFVGDNEVLLAALQSVFTTPGDHFFYLWGPEGVGKSHLLQAFCQAADKVHLHGTYLPLTECIAMGPAILQGLSELDYLCLDDVSALAQDREWEEALFHCYNGLKAEGACLLIAAGAPPAALPWCLPDLASRMNACTVFEVQALGDADLTTYLQKRAAQRGMELPLEVADYLLKRVSRSMADLEEVLNQLDRASLSAQRRLTVPFARQTLTNL